MRFQQGQTCGSGVTREPAQASLFACAPDVGVSNPDTPRQAAAVRVAPAARLSVSGLAAPISAVESVAPYAPSAPATSADTSLPCPTADAVSAAATLPTPSRPLATRGHLAQGGELRLSDDSRARGRERAVRARRASALFKANLAPALNW